MFLSPLNSIKSSQSFGKQNNKPCFNATFKGNSFDTVSFTGKTREELIELAKETSSGIKDAEVLLDPDGTNFINKFVAQIVNGDSNIINQIRNALNAAEKNLYMDSNIEKFVDKDHRTKVKLKTGKFETVFENRTEIYSNKECSFDEFLKKPGVLGKDYNKVIVSCTGWTKPPAVFLANSNNLTVSGLFKNQPENKWQAIAEEYYVQLVKKHLSEIVTELKSQGCNVQDLVFQYGVTPEGVDRAVEEFCHENNLKCVGVTCYDWIKYLDKKCDKIEKPPIYIAESSKQFGEIMGGANKIIITGGRSFASIITDDQKEVVLGKVVPVDICDEIAQIKIPGLVLKSGNITETYVLNAAKQLLSQENTNPINYPEVKGKINVKNLRPSVFWTTEVLKSALENLELAKKVQNTEK